MHYDLIRTKRKTLAIYIRPEGKVEVRAPIRASKAVIDRFVDSKAVWIEQSLKKLENIRSDREIIRIKPTELERYKKKAEAHLIKRCGYFAELMGVHYRKIKINTAKTRWGSCNSKGDLNFTFRLILLPEDLIDYVVVHELAHIREMNHSDKFWSVVEEAMPNYKARKKQLKELQRRIELIVE